MTSIYITKSKDLPLDKNSIDWSKVKFDPRMKDPEFREKIIHTINEALKKHGIIKESF